MRLSDGFLAAWRLIQRGFQFGEHGLIGREKSQATRHFIKAGFGILDFRRQMALKNGQPPVTRVTRRSGMILDRMEQ